MNRRNLLLATGASLTATIGGQARATPLVTQWTVRASEAYDALYFFGPLAGDPFLAPHYAAEIAEFKLRLPAAAISFLETADKMAKSRGAVMSASVSKFFSVGPDGTIDDLLASLDAAETLLKPRLMASDDWGGEAYWATMMQLTPPLRMVLQAMAAADFRGFRNRRFDPIYAKRAPELRSALSRLDVAPQISRVLARPVSPKVEVILNYFDYPRSQRLFGQKFLTHHSYSNDTIFWIAAHEMLHPPMDREGEVFKAALEVLGRDPFVIDLVNRRDPGEGLKGDLAGYVEECFAQALDHVVSVRMRLPRNPRKDWLESHNPEILAACFYGLLFEDDYAKAGRGFEPWLARAISTDRLSSSSLIAAGRRVLGADPRALWQPYAG